MEQQSKKQSYSKSGFSKNFSNISEVPHQSSDICSIIRENDPKQDDKLYDENRKPMLQEGFSFLGTLMFVVFLSQIRFLTVSLQSVLEDFKATS